MSTGEGGPVPRDLTHTELDEHGMTAPENAQFVIWLERYLHQEDLVLVPRATHELQRRVIARVLLENADRLAWTLVDLYRPDDETPPALDALTTLEARAA